ncbi:MAG: glycosyltransferase [Chloroflexota bacterium]|nr:MAG: glycosyltransferase [Chloroflexota bacterium]
MRLSVVVPVYNEEAVVLSFHARLAGVLDGVPCAWEICYVDDGSTDQTAEMIRHIMNADARVRLLQLSRNFGHQVALTAGMDHADGDAVITMDGDGQHPPELIPELLALYQKGYDLVLTQRRADKDAGLIKRLTSRGFYWLINRLSQTYILPDSADFRLMSREAVLGLRQVREQHRFLRGIVTWMGFSWAVVHFQAQPRLAGCSKYSSRKMLELAGNAVFSFSTVPLRLAIWMGFILLFFSATEVAWVLYLISVGRQAELVPGWTSLMLALLGIGGVQLVLLGLVGQYVGLIFQETKKRPLYFLKPQPRRGAAAETVEIEENLRV